MNKFTITIITLIILVMGANHAGLFDRLASSETYGWIINDQTNPYLSHEDRMEGWGYDERTQEHWGDYKETFMIGADGRLISFTVLSPEDMKIQDEQGCTACHNQQIN